MSDRMKALRNIAEGMIEASLQDASADTAKNMAGLQKLYGWTDAEVRDALLAEDTAMMQRYRTIGFAAAWEGLE